MVDGSGFNAAATLAAGLAVVVTERVGRYFEGDVRVRGQIRPGIRVSEAMVGAIDDTRPRRTGVRS